MLPVTFSLGHFPKARSDTCPLDPPSFPGRGRQRIPQMKVKLLGVGGGEGDCSEKRKKKDLLAGVQLDWSHWDKF